MTTTNKKLSTPPKESAVKRCSTKSATKNLKISRTSEGIAKKKKVFESPERIITILHRTEEWMKVKFHKDYIKKLIVSEDDPAVVINTYVENLVAGINHVNQLAPADRPPIPAWALPFIVNYPIEYDAFLSAIMNVLQDVTAGGIVDNFCIAPNSLVEWGNISGKLTDINRDRLVVTIANGAQGPLGRVHLFNGRQAVQVSINANLSRPLTLTLHHQQAFL